ncbi:hemagglutinin [Enterobacter asburiae]|nr:hemagglutinin [Enterobacter asburiae]
MKTQPGYQNTEYGPGSAFWTKGSAAAGLLAGALGGNLKAGAAAGAAPLLATLVKEQKDPTARAALHGIVAAALTQLSGGSSADGLKAGAIGAITASAMTDHLVSALYGDKKSSDLTPEEKRLVSSLVSIAGGLAGAAVTDGSVSMAATASETAKVEVENNSLGVAPPVPVPVPGVPVSPGDQVTKNANDKIASAVDDLFDAVDKATQCSFGRACSSDDSNQESKPNVAGNMTDNEKAEYGGAGSGSPTPPEDDHEKQESKPVDKLNQKQESAIKKIDNTIKNALKDHDITGTLKDMDGNPVPKESGGYWDHMQEMQNTLRGLRNHADTLKNFNNPEAQAAYGRATDAINKIESALKGHGI